MNINEIINKIAWWIPFKGLRNAVREYLLYKVNLNIKLLEEIKNINKNYKELNKKIYNLSIKFELILNNLDEYEKK